MKCKYIFITLLTLASCSKEVSVKELPDLPSEAIKEATLKVRIKTEQPTKVNGFLESFDYEDKINNIQLLIFDTSTGNLNYYDNLGTNQQGTPALYLGPKTVYVLANGPSLTAVSTLTELENLTFSMKEYNSTSGMIMMAKEECDLESDLELELYLERFVSRIYVSTVRNSLPAAYSKIKVLSAFMGNVSSQITSYGNYVSTASLINPKGVLDDPVYDMTCRDVNKEVVVGSTGSVQIPLYCYFNQEAGPDDGTFVSLKIEVAGTAYYYTVYLDPADLRKNLTNDIHLNVIGLGSDDPATPVNKSAIDYTIDVDDWDFSSSYSEEI